jgi:hypothetical protein
MGFRFDFGCILPSFQVSCNVTNCIVVEAEAMHISPFDEALALAFAFVLLDDFPIYVDLT